MHASADGQELDIAVKLLELARDAGDAVPLMLHGFFDEAVVSLETALVNHLGDLCDLAPHDVPQPGADTADEAQRKDTVPDHQFAGRQSLEIQTVHLVAG